MADVTYYVALPFVRDDAGSPVAGAAEECQSSSGALRRAEVLSKAEGSVGAVEGGSRGGGGLGGGSTHPGGLSSDSCKETTDTGMMGCTG